jgi:hypothetical protein
MEQLKYELTSKRGKRIFLNNSVNVDAKPAAGEASGAGSAWSWSAAGGWRCVRSASGWKGIGLNTIPCTIENLVR